MIDVSDGLALDLSGLCSAGGIGARVRRAALPVDPVASLDEALGGGEDYELVATLPTLDAVAAARSELADTFGVPLTIIGDITERTDVVAVSEDGSERPLEPAGWDHFLA